MYDAGLHDRDVPSCMERTTCYQEIQQYRGAADDRCHGYARHHPDNKN